MNLAGIFHSAIRVVVVFSAMYASALYSTFRRVQTSRRYGSILTSLQVQPKLSVEQNSRTTRLCRLHMTSSTDESLVLVEKLVSSISEKGDVIRQLKAAKSSKETISSAVTELLSLKKEYEALVGKPFDPPKEVSKPAETTKKVKAEASGTSNASQAKGVESSVITPRSVDYSAW